MSTADSDTVSTSDPAERSALAGAAWADAGPARRAEALRALAGALDEHAASLADTADADTSLGGPRLLGEVARTSFQLRMFADLILGADPGVRIDRAVPGPPPAGRPELCRTHVPVGPVLVFGAGNFPLAFGVLGGDTASALAAGCPVLAKVHPGHARTDHAVLDLTRTVLDGLGHPADVVIAVGTDEQSRDLLINPRVRAAAFTGSQRVGRMLWDLAASRPDPIPFFGELGSVNPVFVGRSASVEAVAAGFVESLAMSNGQLCTKPGVIVVPAGSGFSEHTADRAREVGPAPMLGEATVTRFREAVTELASASSMAPVSGTVAAIGSSTQAPVLLRTSAADVLTDPRVFDLECFGPAAVIVEYDTDEEALALADVLPGCLVSVVHGEETDTLCRDVVRRLVRVSGRIVWNGWPTGVAVSPAQTHGGPWPATTAAGFTAVGTAAIDRFRRPVTFQSFPAVLLPAELAPAHLGADGGPPWTDEELPLLTVRSEWSR